MTTHPRRRWALVAAAAAAALTLSACGSDEPAAAGGDPSVSGVPGLSDVPGLPDPETEPTIDACSLLTDEEVTPIIGPNEGGTPDSGFGESSCSWENEETSYSVTLWIGSAGTAAGGTLPAESDFGPTEPGPDGIRFAPSNLAEFVVDDRACEIQVVTSVTDDADRPTAVELIGLVRDRV